MALSFYNPGEIDPLSFSTFGLNAKPNSTNPIGFFGTGLKYAIAVVLRLGGKITIYSGKTRYSFSTAPETFREKEFTALYVAEGRKKPVRLPYTTELGKKWEPWMAFRELYCNAKDEGGDCAALAMAPKDGHTVIIVDLPEMMEAFEKRSAFMLNPTSKPLFVSAGVEVYPGRSNGIYYRGILVGQTEHDHEFTYNVTQYTDLTEDRTIKNPYLFNHYVVQCLMCAGAEEANILDKVLVVDNTEFEAALPWGSTYMDPSERFLEYVGTMRREGRPVLPAVTGLHDNHVKFHEDPERIDLTATEQAMLDRAFDTLSNVLGYTVDPEKVVPVATLGTSIFGRAHRGKIFIARRTFDAGQVWVTGTLLEEYGHQKLMWKDETRDMQNALVNLVATLAERLND